MDALRVRFDVDSRANVRAMAGVIIDVLGLHRTLEHLSAASIAEISPAAAQSCDSLDGDFSRLLHPDCMPHGT
jgi:hypothetical protein